MTDPRPPGIGDSQRIYQLALAANRALKAQWLFLVL